MAPPTLATSLAPHPERRITGGREIGRLNQYRCIESWRASGFHVFSVNAADEADAVRTAYPDVPVIVAERDARGLCGRPLIPVSEMIRALRGAGVTWGGIASADVRVAAPGLLLHVAGEGRNRDMAVFLNRANVAHPCDEAGELDSGGPSAVLFDVRHSAALDFEPFALGLPGWGRALAMTLLLAGSQAYSPVGAVLRHLDHPKLWGEEVHRRFFSAFRTRFSPELRALQRTEGADALPSLAAVADLGRHAEVYADLADRRAGETGLTESARRHRSAYAAAIADLIQELATTAPRPGISGRL
ncbi:hypothetical protein MCBMB27_00790 [Methylobacterium phyllosphaerae]|uniref:Uncharacterized protein n=1 Tax=Methylobacterium phyllosphaerae TaxID=418223 RepID=A0AAE8HYC6_9HYPH|nr:hypothetical protein [Methylobacterium phyllosphaerae]APT30081.1 hypothetical protein MCBMB27_00790 [Methylobacterium phyllosphaerae]SFH75415.1 hypothetical protein SAMN05192567_1564 [Methylobacterium phyllosphaerae]